VIDNADVRAAAALGPDRGPNPGEPPTTPPPPSSGSDDDDGGGAAGSVGWLLALALAAWALRRRAASARAGRAAERPPRRAVRHRGVDACRLGAWRAACTACAAARGLRTVT